MNSISVGSGTNIQDNALVHVAKSNISGNVLPTTIGNNVTIGEYIISLQNENHAHLICFHAPVNLQLKPQYYSQHCKQVMVLFYMDVLLKMRLLLGWVPRCLMELMLRKMPWWLQEPLLGKIRGFHLERFVASHSHLCSPVDMHVLVT